MIDRGVGGDSSRRKPLNSFGGMSIRLIDLNIEGIFRVAQSKNKERRVLIVDDEAALREIIEQEFVRRGWKTILAGGGFEAFESLQKKTVDLVISDVRMAKGTGLQLLDSIQGLPEPRPLIVLISGYSEVDEYKAINRGASGFFLKPFQLREFADSVLEIFEKESNKKKSA